MKSYVRVINEKGFFEIYFYFQNGVCFVYSKEGNKIFISDRYKIDDPHLTAKQISVSSREYYQSIQQAMAISQSKFKDEKLVFGFKTLNLKNWRETILWKFAGIEISPEGFLNVRIWRKNDSSFSQAKQKVKDIDAAIRMQEKILNRYLKTSDSRLSEKDLMYLVQKIFQTAKNNFLFWNDLVFEKKEDMRKELRDLSSYLKDCINSEKRAIKNRAEAVAYLKDKLERDNPSALAARCVGAIQSSSKRLKGIDRIVFVISLRKKLLIKKKAEVLLAMDRAVNILELLVRVCPAKKTNYLYGIGKAIGFLEDILVFPFSSSTTEAKIILRETLAGYYILSSDEILEKINLALRSLRKY